MRRAAAIILAAMLAPSLADAAGCDPNAKLKWTGSGTSTTRPFHMDSGWEVQWELSPKALSFSIIVKAKEAPLDAPQIIAANQSTDLPGSSYQPNAGTFYLNINSYNGAWKVCVVPVPD
jgi:hypothetical protein